MVNSEIVKTSTPAEKCPYWNHPFKRSGGPANDRSVRYFDLTGIDSLTREDSNDRNFRGNNTANPGIGTIQIHENPLHLCHPRAII